MLTLLLILALAWCLSTRGHNTDEKTKENKVRKLSGYPQGTAPSNERARNYQEARNRAPGKSLTVTKTAGERRVETSEVEKLVAFIIGLFATIILLMAISQI